MKTTLNHETLAQESLQASVWKVRPFQIVSLLEMLKHYAGPFYWMTRFFYSLQKRVEKAIAKRGGDSLPTKGEADLVKRLAKRIELYCSPVEFENVLERLYFLNSGDQLLQPLRGEPLTLARLKFQLEELSQEIAKTLYKNKFMLIPSHDAAYYDNPDLFGPEVAQQVPKANSDIKEAGNCYATGSYTASVFHFMRVAEFGLRKLAQKLHVKLTDKGNPLHVEYATWDKVITACKNEITAIRLKSAGPRKEAKLSLYSDAADHCLFITSVPTLIDSLSVYCWI